jgi:tetratricopeptide (TPR) repeat protein
MGRKTPRKLEQVPPMLSTHANGKAARDAKPLMRHVAATAALFVLAFLAYSNSFTGGFPLDNRFLILQNPAIREATSGNLQLILHHAYWWPTTGGGLYRPLTTLSYLFNYAILGNGEQPAGYHWFNFLLHFANVLLVYALCLRLIRKLWPSVLIAALWAVHPVLTESVTNIIGRADLLSSFAILSGLLIYLKSTEVTGWRQLAWLSGLMVVATIGVFSKESAVAILGVIVLYEFTWWKERKQIRGLLLGCAAVTPPILLLLILRTKIPDVITSPSYTDNPIFGAHFLTGRLTAISVMGRYLWLLFWPVKLSCDYSYGQIQLATGSAQNWVTWLAVAAVIAVTVGLFKWNRVAFFFAAFAFVTFIPVSNLVFLTGTIMAERFLYLPAAGYAACVVLAVYYVSEQIRFRILAPIALVLAIAGLGYRTWERNFDWKDESSLWTAAARTSPGSFKAHKGLARALYDSDPSRSNISEVIAEAEQSVAILDPLPDSLSTSNAYVDAATYHSIRGDLGMRRRPDGTVDVPPESDREYRRSLELLMRGLSIDKTESQTYAQEKIAHGEAASSIPPLGYAPLYRQLAITYLRLGDYQKAYDAAVYACALGPHAGDGYLLLAEIFRVEGRTEDEVLALIEYFLTSKNPGILVPLQKLYQSGLDQKGCAISQIPSGLVLNKSCELVHNELCKASDNLVKNANQGKELDFAEEIESTAKEEFGCAADPKD